MSRPIYYGDLLSESHLIPNCIDSDCDSDDCSYNCVCSNKSECDNGDTCNYYCKRHYYNSGWHRRNLRKISKKYDIYEPSLFDFTIASYRNNYYYVEKIFNIIIKNQKLTEPKLVNFLAKHNFTGYTYTSDTEEEYVETERIKLKKTYSKEQDDSSDSEEEEDEYVKEEQIKLEQSYSTEWAFV